MESYGTLSIQGRGRMLTLVLVYAALIAGLASPKRTPWTLGIFAAAAIAALVFLVFDRNSYLPFLGPTVAPIAALDPSFPANASLKIEIRPPPGTVRVLYWAAEIDALHPQPAYGDVVANSGLASVHRGKAVLRIAPPGQYAVGWKGTLPRHVHWRAVFPSGILGEVMTTPVVGGGRCGCGGRRRSTVRSTPCTMCGGM
jgi:hypothetical protein